MVVLLQPFSAERNASEDERAVAQAKGENKRNLK